MSKKRKTDPRENNGEIVPNDLSVRKSNGESTADISTAVDSPAYNETAKAGVFPYLKNNLWIVGVIAFLALGTLGAGLKYLDDEAQREIVRRANQKGKLNNQPEAILNKVNPFLPDPEPTPMPKLSKEYIYAGSRLLAVEDAGASVAPPTDVAIWRPANGEWWVMGQQGSQQVTQAWGVSTDVPVPGDYDGDGKTDFAVWRRGDGNWYIINSGGGGGQLSLGLSTDVPAPADYDGDGRTDAAVYRDGTWYIQQSSNYQVVTRQFGLSSDVPSPADYNGDGKADIAVWRNGDMKFYLQTASQDYEAVYMGVSSIKPVSGDYDGDGRADFAVRSGANWVIFSSTSNQLQSAIPWEQAGDIPVQNDYDGDGKVDIAVWRNSNATWYIKNSADNSTRTVQWGMENDIPVPAYYRR